MSKIKIILLLMVSLVYLASCELDNLEGPTAELYGSFIDDETDELVEQDIIRGGELVILEHGYDPVTPQFINYQTDGTYRNSRLFTNTYTVVPVKTNFQPIDSMEVKIDGSTQLDFRVTPYIRIKNVNIAKNGDKVVATFSLEQTGSGMVQKIGLYAHEDPNVGEPFRLANADQDINAVVDPSDTYTLEIDVPSNSNLKPGTSYFFRVGALYDAPEARFNYAPSVEIVL